VAAGVDGTGRQSGSLPASIRRSAYFLSSFRRVCDLGEVGRKKRLAWL
jgi:hypothetical protein